MDKQKIGAIIIVFAIVMAVYTFWITADLKKLNQFLHQSCTLPADVCPFNNLVPAESILGFVVAAVMAAFGAYIMFAGKGELKGRVVESKKIEQAVMMLAGDEQAVYNAIIAAEGTIFQSELVEKSGLDKVKVSRILDRLEGRGLIDRKRRGMSNVIVLRH